VAVLSFMWLAILCHTFLCQCSCNDSVIRHKLLIHVLTARIIAVNSHNQVNFPDHVVKLPCGRLSWLPSAIYCTLNTHYRIVS